MSIDPREQARRLWVKNQLQSVDSLELLAGDASFRRYFRLCSGKSSYILMDAPYMRASCRAFIAISRTLQSLGICAPKIFSQDCDQGFLLLSDFGNCQLFTALSHEKTSVEHYYKKALSNLLVLQKCQGIIDYTLPIFDLNLYQRELTLFEEWYLDRHLQRTLTKADRQILGRVSELLIESALSQPQVCVHRDYHSRNLMLLSNGRLGILDFQDAVRGPVSYDAISLLRDCYVAWPEQQVRTWLLDFQQQLLLQGILSQDDPQQFLRWCDWMSLQRHLKCLGIFSRLYYRDNRPSYMKNIPRVKAYARSVCRQYPELIDLEPFLWV